MPCSVGRDTPKYKSGAASTLQDVTENGNSTTLSIETGAFFVGDGSQLTNIPGFGGFGTLEQVTATANTTSHEITFENTFTSFEARGNVVVLGNVTALTYYGDGSTLTGIVTLSDFGDNVSRITNLETSNGLIRTDLTSNALRITNLETSNGLIRTDLTDNVLRITNLETSDGVTTTDLTSNALRITNLETSNGLIRTDLTDNVLRITNLEGETQPVSRGGTNLTSYTVGDILYASATNTLSKLSIGGVGAGNVLTVTGSTTIAWQPPSGGSGGSTIGNLQQVTTQGSSTDVYVTFTNPTTSLRASGNVLVDGNVTADTYFGDGSNITGVVKTGEIVNIQTAVSNLQTSNGLIGVDMTSNALRITNLETSNGLIRGDLTSNALRITNLETSNGLIRTDLTDNALRITNLETSNGVTTTDLTSNALRITNLETSNGLIRGDLTSNVTRIEALEDTTIISNSSGITTGFTKGDLIYASVNNQLSKLTLGTTEGHVLTANLETGLPVWKAPTGGSGTIANYSTNGGNTGISNINPQYTLHVGSNVVVDDTGADVMYIRGNIYSTRDLTVVGSTVSDQVHCQRLFIKNTKVVAERPTRVLRLT